MPFNKEKIEKMLLALRLLEGTRQERLPASSRILMH